MPPINPSLEQWMLQQRNRGINTGLGVRGGWGDIVRNDRGLMGAPMSGDQYALLLNGQNANQTRQLRTQADLQRAQEESQFLDSISQQDLGGIYDAPSDPRQAQLQQILNRDYLAREAGSRRSMAGILSNQEIDRKMAPYRLNVAQFRDAQAQDKILNALRQQSFAAGREDEMAQRKFNERKFEDDTLYRQAQLQRQDRDFDYKGQVTDRRADQQDFRNMTVMEREMARQAATDSRNAFNAAVEMGQRGIPTRDIEAAFPELSAAQRQILRGYDQRSAEQGKFAESVAAQFTKEMQGVPTQDESSTTLSKWNPFNWVPMAGAVAQTAGKALPFSPMALKEIATNAAAGRMPFSNPFDLSEISNAYDRMNAPSVMKTDRTPEDIKKDTDKILEKIQKNPKYRDMLVYDPDTNTVSPSPAYAGRSSAASESVGDGAAMPVPRNIRGKYQEGKVYNIGGTPMRYQNGFMVR